MLHPKPDRTLVNPNDLCIAHLRAGGLVLARDLRQARILRRLHDRAQVAAGHRVWPTAQVLPLDAWLELEWGRASLARPELPRILPPVALRWLWRAIVSRGAPALLDPADLGARARASWLTLRAQGGDLAAVARWPLTRDQQAFLSWSRSVETELHERDACDGGDLARLFVEVSAIPAEGPPILVAGFRRLTPAQEALFASLKAAGRGVARLSLPEQPGTSFRHRAADPDSERVAMLAWLRERVAAAPAGLHGIIVPDLDANRGALERALAGTLQPDLELPGMERDDRAFDLAGGRPLTSQPVVEDALAALACAAGTVDWATASSLLRSPHLASSELERGERIAAELALRASPGAARLRAPRLAGIAARAGAARFAAAIGAASASLDGPRRRAAGTWAEAFGNGLAGWGWPGDASRLGGREFQAAHRLRELLRELAGLGNVAPDLDAVEALAELRRLAAAPFQPESGEPAVFVLDSYDDTGVQFDSLWVAGLTATAWPRPVAVDPLLPIEIQRQLAMPGATPESRVAEARDVIAHWRARSGTLVLSWPQRENDTDVDGTPLLPAGCSALATGTPVANRERLCFDARLLEAVPEVPLPPLASNRVKGGARLLELQAQCGFRAFAELRLGAVPLEEPQAGFDRRLRGIVLHRALEDVWTRLGTQSALAALDAPARKALAASAVDAALASAAPEGAGPHAVSLERDWQRQAIARLMELDLARPPFTVVETERALELAIGGLELKLRVDRMDHVGNELVVIDYKTGKTQGSAWRGARMDSPQLPLYAVLHPAQPTGIAFAGFSAARAAYVGVGRDGAAIAGLKPAEKFALTEAREAGFTWPQVRAQWRAWLERLAADFRNGHAGVDPKRAADTCRLCHLATLCRVEPAAPDDAGEEGDDDA
jgi:ATP-dependent helicase/nuclease subunit B